MRPLRASLKLEVILIKDCTIVSHNNCKMSENPERRISRFTNKAIESLAGMEPATDCLEHAGISRRRREKTL